MLLRCESLEPPMSQMGQNRKGSGPSTCSPVLPVSRDRRSCGSTSGSCPQAAVSNRSKPILYSITSSASASSVGGRSSPSALAVLRLITSSNLDRLHDRQVGGLLALAECGRRRCRLRETRRSGCCRSTSARRPRRKAVAVDRRQLASSCDLGQPSAQVDEQRVREDDERGRSRAARVIERGVDIALGGDIDNMDLQPKRRGRRSASSRYRTPALGLFGLTRTPITLAGGSKPLQQLKLFRH